MPRNEMRKRLPGKQVAGHPEGVDLLEGARKGVGGPETEGQGQGKGAGGPDPRPGTKIEMEIKIEIGTEKEIEKGAPETKRGAHADGQEAETGAAESHET